MLTQLALHADRLSCTYKLNPPWLKTPDGQTLCFASGVFAVQRVNCVHYLPPRCPDGKFGTGVRRLHTI